MRAVQTLRATLAVALRRGGGAGRVNVTGAIPSCAVDSKGYLPL